MTDCRPVDILLATYNGEKFLRQQLESLFRQTWQEFRLIVRDDVSSDSTVLMLNEFQARYPGKMTVINDGLGNLGAFSNFSVLLGHSKSGYVLFCDQDDVWLDDKIEAEMEVMLRAETEYGPVPLLVHSDLAVVGENLAVIAESFWKSQKLDVAIPGSVSKALLNNVVTGCTMLLNRKAVEISVPVPAQAIMHDWWVTILVSKYGKVIPLKRVTVLYRQHGRNAVGAKDVGPGYFVRKIASAFGLLGKYRAMLRSLPFRANLPVALFWKIVCTVKRVFS